MISMNLSFLRKANHFSQEEVAEKIGVSRQAVAKWETGETVPDLKNSIALAELYDVSLDDLVKYNEEEQGVPIGPKGKHIFGTVTVGERGQIVIPKKARDMLDVEPGESLMVLGDDNQHGIALIKSDIFLRQMQEILKVGGLKE